MADVTNTFYTGEGFVGYGSQWLIGQDDGSPETFVAVADIDSIQFGEMTANVVNKTHLRSPGRAHEKIATLRDLGPFTMTGNLRLSHGSQNNAGGDGFTAGGLIAIHRSLEERNMKLLLSDGSPGTELPFRGVVSSLTLGNVELENLVKFTAQVQPLSDFTADLP
jgi:hypothetical protein